jgi:hypothetical protein
MMLSPGAECQMVEKYVDECSIAKLWKEAVMSRRLVHDAVTRGRVSNGRKQMNIQ